MSVPDNQFWTYSLATYGRTGVAAECITLQDRFRLDVNILLLCCWLGSLGSPLSRSGAAQAAALAEEWTAPVVAPLRAIRRHLKPRMTDERVAMFRDQIAALELEAEKIQQNRLFEHFSALVTNTGAPIVQTAACNLAHYLSALDLQLEAPLRDSLVKLLVAAFPDASEVDIVSYLAVPVTDQPI